ncbi:MAG: nucleotidyltransferase domain-containing protein [Myxococcota bacterium]
MAVWLFGSRATDCARTDSDWDVLVLAPRVSDFHRHRWAHVDLITVRWPSPNPQRWLTSELAVHVSAFGKLIHDHDIRDHDIWDHADWTKHVDVDAATHLKIMRTQKRMTAYTNAAPNLSSPVLKRRSVMLRRDFQRIDALRTKGIVPPSAWLDDEWRQRSHSARRCMMQNYGADPSSILFNHLIAA